jgi:hypothetical protein
MNIQELRGRLQSVVDGLASIPGDAEIILYTPPLTLSDDLLNVVETTGRVVAFNPMFLVESK